MVAQEVHQMVDKVAVVVKHKTLKLTKAAAVVVATVQELEVKVERV
jgi:hypothetical protein